MRILIALLLFCGISSLKAAECQPEDIHPKVFKSICCWLSDTTEPIVTEINLDAVRANQNQFDYDSVKKESGWTTYREEKEMLRFQVSTIGPKDYSALFQENGGGSLTTQKVIRFTIESRALTLDGRETTITVLRVHSIQAKE
jgi:hypothetical protein